MSIFSKRLPIDESDEDSSDHSDKSTKNVSKTHINYKICKIQIDMLYQR